MAGKTLRSERLSQSQAHPGGFRAFLASAIAREIFAMSLLLGVAFLVLSILSFDSADTGAVYPGNLTPANLGGRFGAVLIGAFYTWFGVATYLFVALFAVWAMVIFFRRSMQGWVIKSIGFCLAVTAFAGFFGGSMYESLSMPSSGGIIGIMVYDLLTANFGLTGAFLILSFVLASGFLMATDILFYPLIRDFFRVETDAAAAQETNEELNVMFEGTPALAGPNLNTFEGPAASEAPSVPMSPASHRSRRVVERLLGIFGHRSSSQTPAAASDKPSNGVAAVATAEADTDEASAIGAEDAAAGEASEVKPAKPRAILSEEQRARLRELRQKEAEAYRSPPPELLDQGRKADQTNVKRETDNAAQMIVDTLRHFNIEASVIDIKRGPTITLYELTVPPNLQLKKIATLENNLRMMLQASQIRILAPIPGRNTVGVEVPNRARDTVSLREVIATPEFAAAAKKMQLPIAMGLDNEGKPLIRDLAKAPHLLIAGTTGSGKSVMQNVILLSLLAARHYQNVRLMLVDPKCVELTPYHDIGFLITPVVTDMSKAVLAFEWLVEEMERRYAMFAATRTKKITEYNALSPAERRERLIARGMDGDEAPDHIPYIVAMVDELADMMMATSDTRVDELICRIAQKARAAGIHLILATQRPSADVVTGLIKANVPARIAFRLPSQVDSRTIINAVGAEKLLGMGDMLVDWNDGAPLLRAQSAFCDTPEIERVCDAVRKQATPEFLIQAKKLAPARADDDVIGGQPKHEMLDQAIEQVLTSGRASAQFLRSALRIGYNAATTIIMQMEMLGILGPSRGSKEREILMTIDEWRALNASVEDDMGDHIEGEEAVLAKIEADSDEEEEDEDS